MVARLWSLAGPDRAYFGQKDAQQVMVIRRMALDLALPTEVIPCPTVREPDGLALSSRNVHLSPEERAAAPILHKALAAIVFVAFGIIGAFQAGGYVIVEVLYGPNWVEAGKILLFVSLDGWHLLAKGLALVYL